METPSLTVNINISGQSPYQRDFVNIYYSKTYNDEKNSYYNEHDADVKTWNHSYSILLKSLSITINLPK